VQVALVPSTKPRLLVIAAAVVLALLLLAIAGGTITRTDSRSVDRVALSSIPAGASLHHVGDRAVVLVRDGDDVTAFVGAVYGVDALVSCAPRPELATALRAARYRLDGSRIGGPGPDRLDQYATHLDGDQLVIATSHRFGTPALRWSDGLAKQFTDAGPGVCPPA
jgi:hypothetical protein